MCHICMACKAIPIIAFHGVEYIYVYIYTLMQVYVVYVVKEVASFQGAQSNNTWNIFLKFYQIL